jgi:hypothetical protein
VRCKRIALTDAIGEGKNQVLDCRMNWHDATGQLHPVSGAAAGVGVGAAMIPAM